MDYGEKNGVFKNSPARSGAADDQIAISRVIKFVAIVSETASDAGVSKAPDRVRSAF